MTITKAEPDDLKAILELQMLAYQSEAELLNNYSIPPLLETLEDIEQEYRNGIILKAIDENGQIVGSVRGYAKDGTFYIGKLIVLPDRQGMGIGSQLLLEIERICSQPRFELFTSNKSVKNLRLYEKLGYVEFKEKDISPDLIFVYLEKHSSQSRA